MYLRNIPESRYTKRNTGSRVAGGGEVMVATEVVACRVAQKIARTVQYMDEIRDLYFMYML